ncbi:MAG: FIST C-terminal domain-containing protein [Clostridiales Family XIII bacterium]|jgi:hypothetical protein|nr:FIST C-terminal domain-containing protein [Clostridiales Family XIII bacterium]
MIKMFTAHTSEMDFVDDAVAEVLQQLKIKEGIPPHAIGVITCHTEFVQTGVVKALCEQLPFPVVGCTTLGSATGGTESHQMLAITVLAGEDVEFSVALTGAISSENVGPPIQEAYDRALEGLSAPSPALALAFSPFLNAVEGSRIFKHLASACGDTPLYGMFSCSENPDFTGSLTLWNGDAAQDVMAIVLARGNIKPRFCLTSLSDDRMGKQKGTITDAEESIIRAVDGVPALDFLETCGISRENVIKAPSSIPVMIDHGDGAMLAYGIYNTTPEGYIHVAADVSPGASLAIGMQDYNGILSTAEAILRQMTEGTRPLGILMFPCLSRSMMLGLNSEDELRLAVKQLGDATPYHIAYSGGEICPVYASDGTTRNRFHNFTFTACVFEA